MNSLQLLLQKVHCLTALPLSEADKHSSEISRMINKGWAYISENHVYLTTAGKHQAEYPRFTRWIHFDKKWKEAVTFPKKFNEVDYNQIAFAGFSDVVDTEIIKKLLKQFDHEEIENKEGVEYRKIINCN